MTSPTIPEPPAADDAQPEPIRVGSLAAKTAGVACVAVFILWWASRGISSADLRAQLQDVRLGVVIATMAVFTLAYFTVEVLSVGTSWRKNLDPNVTWRDIRALICGKQVLFAVQPLLTKLVAPLYFWRHGRVAPWRAVSATEFVGICELTVVMSLVSAGVAFSGLEVGVGLWVLVGAWWALVALAAVWMSSPRLQQRFPKLAGSGLLYAFTHATRPHLAYQLVTRTALQLITLGCIWVLLAELGAKLTATQLLAFGPLFLYSSLLPISVGGFGGPQGLAVAVLAGRWHVLPPDRALAFSLVWSSGALILQATVGLVYLPRMVGLLRSSKPAAASDPRQLSG
jgi:hypothetical protein